jgi:hypothetical protein
MARPCTEVGARQETDRKGKYSRRWQCRGARRCGTSPHAHREDDSRTGGDRGALRLDGAGGAARGGPLNTHLLLVAALTPTTGQLVKQVVMPDTSDAV